MWIQSPKIYVHDRARRVPAECPNCSNQVAFQLLWNKAGLGLGIPIIMLFTDKARITTHKEYHLGCPVCGHKERITKDVAKGLIAEGADK